MSWTLRRRNVGAAALLEAKGPLSDNEQATVIDYLEQQNATSSTLLVVVLSVLHGVVGFLFVWLALGRGDIIMMPSGHPSSAGSLESLRSLSASGSSRGMTLLQIFQGALLIVGGASLAFHCRRSSFRVCADDVNADPHHDTSRVARRGRNVQLLLCGLAVVPSAAYTVQLLSYGDNSDSAAMERAAVWVLCWWQPAFHGFIAYAHEMLMTTEEGLCELRRHMYRHEKI
jgi:hypothetical protein